MQKARRSSIQSTKTYKAFQAFQPQDLPKAIQSFMTFQTFQSFMTSSPPGITSHSSTFQHLPVQSSTFQCYPVPSSVSRDSTRSSISLIRMQILHTDWFPLETSLSTSRRQYKTFHKTYILQRKGDVAIPVKDTILQNRINSSLRLVKVKC